MTKSAWRDLWHERITKHQCYCYLCEKPITKQKDFSLDHVIPLSRGGRDEESNWQPSHKECNWEKGSLTDEEYRVWKALEVLRHGHTR